MLGLNLFACRRRDKLVGGRTARDVGASQQAPRARPETRPCVRERALRACRDIKSRSPVTQVGNAIEKQVPRGATISGSDLRLHLDALGLHLGYSLAALVSLTTK